MGVLDTPGGLTDHEGQRSEGARRAPAGRGGSRRGAGVRLLLRGGLLPALPAHPCSAPTASQGGEPCFYFGLVSLYPCGGPLSWSLLHQLFLEVVQITHTAHLFWA